MFSNRVKNGGVKVLGITVAITVRKQSETVLKQLILIQLNWMFM